MIQWSGMGDASFRDKPATALAGTAAPAKTIYSMTTVGAEGQRGQTASIARHWGGNPKGTNVAIFADTSRPTKAAGGLQAVHQLLVTGRNVTG